MIDHWWHFHLFCCISLNLYRKSLIIIQRLFVSAVDGGGLYGYKSWKRSSHPRESYCFRSLNHCLKHAREIRWQNARQLFIIFDNASEQSIREYKAITTSLMQKRETRWTKYYIWIYIIVVGNASSQNIKQYKQTRKCYYYLV